MDLEVKLFHPRRVICEAVKITEGQLWTLYETLLH